MSTIIVAMPKIEDAKKISDMLISRGIGRIEICTTGTSILSKAHQPIAWGYLRVYQDLCRALCLRYDS